MFTERLPDFIYFRQAPEPPHPTPRPLRESRLDPYEDYLLQRWGQGERNAAQLHREIRERGYPGSASLVRAYIAHLRTTTADGTPARSRKDRAQALSPRALRWLLSRKREDLNQEEQTKLDQLLSLSPQVETLYALLQAFLKIVREREHQDLRSWMVQAERSGIPELRSFVNGVERDYDAVHAALRLSWSQGITEGKVNKLKTLKRVMLRGVLDIQNTIISLIPRDKPREKIKPDDFGPATRQFWTTARAAYTILNKTLRERLGKDFLDTYTVPIQEQTIEFSKMPDLFMQGRATPYIFLSANNKLYLANARRINTVLLTSINDLLEKYNIEFDLAELNTAIYRFLDDRFRGVIGPFVVDAASQTDSLSYAAAFVAGDQLILVHVAQPIIRIRCKFDEIYKKAEADIKSLSKNSYRLFDVLKMKIIEWRTSDDRQLSASVLIVAPSFSVEFTAYRFSHEDNIRLILGDEFLSIFDDLEDLQEYADYLEYKNRLASIEMPFSREIDKYAAFRYASGTLVSGANSPDLIYLESGMGGDYRFDKLKRFWRQHPRVGWGGDDPMTWSVDDQKTYVRIYRRKDKFQNTLYTRLNRLCWSMKEIEEWYNGGQKAAKNSLVEEESECQCMPENWEVSQKKPSVLPVQLVPKERSLCACVMR